jgi:hypothetical protein
MPYLFFIKKNLPVPFILSWGNLDKDIQKSVIMILLYEPAALSPSITSSLAPALLTWETDHIGTFKVRAKALVET